MKPEIVYLLAFGAVVIVLLAGWILYRNSCEIALGVMDEEAAPVDENVVYLSERRAK